MSDSGSHRRPGSAASMISCHCSPVAHLGLKKKKKKHMKYTFTSNHLPTRQKLIIIQPQFKNQPEGWCWCTLTWRAAVQPWKRFGSCCCDWALCCHLLLSSQMTEKNNNRKECLNFPIGIRECPSCEERERMNKDKCIKMNPPASQSHHRWKRSWQLAGRRMAMPKGKQRDRNKRCIYIYIYIYSLFAKFLTCRDLTNVQRRVRMPSPLLSSLTSRITRKRRKKVMDTLAPSPSFPFWSGERKHQTTY